MGREYHNNIRNRTDIKINGNGKTRIIKSTSFACVIEFFKPCLQINLWVYMSLLLTMVCIQALTAALFKH